MAEEGDEELEYSFLDPDHPLLAKIQAAFTEQLSKQHDIVASSYREAGNELQTLIKHREDVGVTLYSAQQQLAKIQLQLEQMHDGYANVTSKKEEMDASLQKITADYEGRKQEVSEALKRLNKAQDELNQLNVTLRQVEDYNTQMQAEIQVTRRATYKAEDSIKTIEKTKHKQDLLIDTMNERINAKSEEKALLQAQLDAQKKETDSAKLTLRDAETEMQSIEFEKQQLAQQWRSSLIGMQRRDEAMRNVQNSILAQEEEELNIENEIRGVQKSTRAAQEKHEQISALEERNKKEMQYLQGQMTNARAEREKLAEQYNMLKKSLDHTQQKSKTLSLQKQDDQLALNNIEKDIQKASREITRLGIAIEHESSSRATVEQCEANSHKDIQKIQQQIADKESEILKLRNEIERVKVETSHTKEQTKMLADRMKEVQDDFSEKENLISQFEQEIRKRHHQIEKKQLHVDRLNREYDEKRVKLEAVAGSAADVSGPLEAKINHLKNEVQAKIKVNQDLQKSWILKQTELMQLASETDQIKTDSSEMKNKNVILDQKQLRTNQLLNRETKDINDIDLTVKRLRFEMSRWNNSLAQNELKITGLESSNKMVEKEFVVKLQEIEQECMKLERTTQTIKDERQSLQEEIVEAERQVMLWERKIHLEKEIHETLDPSAGQAETAHMRKEIHRMELRRDQLKRRQEQMIVEMEMSIRKRDSITLKYAPLTDKVPTAGTRKKQLEMTKANLRNCQDAAQQCDSTIKLLEEEMERVQATMGEAVQDTQRLEEMKYELHHTTLISDLLLSAKEVKLDRQMNAIRMFEEKRPPSAVDTVTLELENEKKRRVEQVDVLRTLYESFPQGILKEDIWNSFYDGIEVA